MRDSAATPPSSSHALNPAHIFGVDENVFVVSVLSVAMLSVLYVLRFHLPAPPTHPGR